VLFASTLVGVALFHRRAGIVALAGLCSTAVYKILVTGFAAGPGLAGFVREMSGEWVDLFNLMLLLLGFGVLASHFERSKVPELMPRFLPDGWAGGFALLGVVFVLSAFLDNIAASVIGGVIARHVYKKGVSVGFLAGIVAAANAGGAGSVVGDTTTTMMWIAGVSPLLLMKAAVGAVPAFLVVGIAAARQQHRFAPITRDPELGVKVDGARILIVLFVLGSLVSANLIANTTAPGLEHRVPVMGLALWGALLSSGFARRPDWAAARASIRGAVFLVALVALASLMPVHGLPPPSELTIFSLGLLSSLFDNIPLTALALEQGGYDWPLLAYAVGFGGSMAWFGSSAGVALTNLYPGGRSLGRWVRQGWFVPVGYAVGFAASLLTSKLWV